MTNNKETSFDYNDIPAIINVSTKWYDNSSTEEKNFVQLLKENINTVSCNCHFACCNNYFGQICNNTRDIHYNKELYEKIKKETLCNNCYNDNNSKCIKMLKNKPYCISCKLKTVVDIFSNIDKNEKIVISNLKNGENIVMTKNKKYVFATNKGKIMEYSYSSNGNIHHVANSNYKDLNIWIHPDIIKHINCIVQIQDYTSMEIIEMMIIFKMNEINISNKIFVENKILIKELVNKFDFDKEEFEKEKKLFQITKDHFYTNEKQYLEIIRDREKNNKFAQKLQKINKILKIEKQELVKITENLKDIDINDILI
jgi:hypothetical protein